MEVEQQHDQQLEQQPAAAAAPDATADGAAAAAAVDAGAAGAPGTAAAGDAPEPMQEDSSLPQQQPDQGEEDQQQQQHGEQAQQEAAADQQQEQQEQQPQQPAEEAASSVAQLQVFLSMVIQQQNCRPGICRRGEVVPTPAGGVLDWTAVKKGKGSGGGKSLQQVAREREAQKQRWQQQRSGVQKIAGTAGRTFTSRFRGVHQTFPTKRWEAQFRRNGKPTSLGCFDGEDEAARAYDRMMLWCEIHNASGSMKGAVTNFDLSEYEADITWLTSITQEGLIDALRADGRKQASQRTGGGGGGSGGARTRRGGGGGDREGTAGRSTHSGTLPDTDNEQADVSGGRGESVGANAAAAANGAEEEGGDGSGAAPPAAADGESTPRAQQQADGAGRSMVGLDLSLDEQQQQHAAVQLAAAQQQQLGGGGGLLSAATTPGSLIDPANAFLQASPGMQLLFGQLGTILQQQMDEAQASGTPLDQSAALAAAFQVGQSAGAALANSAPSPASAAGLLGGHDGGAFGGGSAAHAVGGLTNMGQQLEDAMAAMAAAAGGGGGGGAGGLDEGSMAAALAAAQQQQAAGLHVPGAEAMSLDGS